MQEENNKKKVLMDTTMSDVRLIYEDEQYKGHIIVSDQFGMTMSGKSLSDIMTDKTVYLRQQASIIMVTKGYIETAIDMENFTWHEGDVILIRPNTIQEIDATSADFDMIAIDFEGEILITENLVLHATKTEWQELREMMHTLWKIAIHKPFRQATVMKMVSAIVSNIQDIAAEPQHMQNKKRISNEEQIFKRFREMLNMKTDNERCVSFYADKLCISLDYLSKAVKDFSGLTVTQWINRAIVLHAKVLLKTTDMKTYEIAERLHFPDYATFSKFFKRETGLSPREFRKGK